MDFVGWSSAGGEVDDFAVDLTALVDGVDTEAREGDLVLIIEGIAAGADLDPGVISPTGYEELADLYSDDSTDTNLSVSWKFMGATPDTSVTVNGADVATRACAAIAYVWRGVDPTTPFDASATTDTGTNSQRFDPPAITTVTPNAVVIGIGANGVANPDASFTTPAGYSNDARRMEDFGSSVTIAAMSKVLATPGADDPPVWDDFGNASTASWCAVTLALRPAPSGVTGTVAATDGADTAAGTGNVIVTGTAAVQEQADTGLADGLITVTGTIDADEGADLSAASGAVTVTGSAGVDEGADTSAGTGTVTVSGAADLTEAPDTAAASGTVAVTGTVELTEGEDLAAASGIVTVTGTADVLEAADTGAAAGEVMASGFFGSINANESGDLAEALGIVLVTGTIDALEGGDIAAAFGSSGPGVFNYVIYARRVGRR